MPGDRDQRGSDIGGGGRTAALVRDDFAVLRDDGRLDQERI